MISGRFGELGELFFEVEIVAADGENFPLEVLLDTGFTSGFLTIDIQDADSLGWSILKRNLTMRTVKKNEYFDLYEGRVILDRQEYIIPVVAGEGVQETLLGLQWLKILPLAVNFSTGLLTLGE
ncbi:MULTISPECIES: hypothetical protein [Spirulina sp. CCY15215]|uniref:hypothetical protein n=1 Tax=Spirulina sp. CCY15215 TaxID=2767591 RepID=UPI0019524BD6|nr:hypothetical protein [Spirulina major]